MQQLEMCLRQQINNERQVARCEHVRGGAEASAQTPSWMNEGFANDVIIKISERLLIKLNVALRGMISRANCILAYESWRQHVFSEDYSKCKQFYSSANTVSVYRLYGLLFCLPIESYQNNNIMRNIVNTVSSAWYGRRRDFIIAALSQKKNQKKKKRLNGPNWCCRNDCPKRSIEV